MDEKKFDEIMHRYVAGKSRGKNVDFAKLEEKENIKARKSPKFVWASLSCFLVIVVTLAIALPLALQPTDSSSKTYYCDVGDIETVYVDSIDVVKTEYHISAQLPNIEYEDRNIAIKKSKIDDRIVGAYFGLSVFDEYFDDIEINIIFENTVVQSFEAYEIFSSETVWKSLPVKYNVKYFDEYDTYCAEVFFKKDGYKYYIEVNYIEAIDIVEILDKIF